MAFPLRISLRKVSVSLAGKTVLRDISWTLDSGQHWAVLGPNGAGKSTFLRLLRGDVRPDQSVDGKPDGVCVWRIGDRDETSPLEIKALARLVSAEQQRACTRGGWRLSGLELVASGFSDTLFVAKPEAGHARASRSLARKLNAGSLLDKSLAALSQGQLRLVLLMRAMVTRPGLLLLDEAFDGLDRSAREALHAAVNEAAKKAAVICAAHRESDLPSCITHLLRLKDGGVEYMGPVGAAGGEDPFFAEKKAPSSRLLFPGAQDSAAGRNGNSPQGPFALELAHVDTYVNRVKVLDALCWQVRHGENWRIAGPNGSGKSTLLRLLAGLEQVALGGCLRWFGREHPPMEERRRETGYLSDLLHATYTYDLTGLELTASGFDGSIGIWRPLAKKELARAREWIAFLGLSDMERTPVSRLSSGTARRFFLARALVGSPRLLLLDEPCSGLDPLARAKFLASLDAVMAAGVQCLYISHHDDDVPDRITHELRLEAGRAIAAGPGGHPR